MIISCFVRNVKGYSKIFLKYRHSKSKWAKNFFKIAKVTEGLIAKSKMGKKFFSKWQKSYGGRPRHFLAQITPPSSVRLHHLGHVDSILYN